MFLNKFHAPKNVKIQFETTVKLQSNVKEASFVGTPASHLRIQNCSVPDKILGRGLILEIESGLFDYFRILIWGFF
ncbi:hypothetical protein DLM75_01135 [Leptospira stimsonii]|uniref:Uncharacterized protein n=1 Tax=Leptospira stimsonii TaxID=2202203 RepID=A0A396Z919_9LEPT|nr:hypothetical protein DLM75_01135 [Leptospira stimsonii]